MVQLHNSRCEGDETSSTNGSDIFASYKHSFISIWLIDLAKELERLGPSTQLDGYGSDLSLAPPTELLPTNVNLYQRANFVTDIEQGCYDVVRVGNIADHVYNNAPGGLIKKFIAMLKPGGFLQWNEVDTAHRRLIKPQVPSPRTDALLQHLKEHQPPRGWIDSLPDIFTRYGLEVPAQCQQHRYLMPTAYAIAVGECVWEGVEKECVGTELESPWNEGDGETDQEDRGNGDGGKGERSVIRKLVQEAKQECKEKGMSVVCDMVVAVGQKVAPEKSSWGHAVVCSNDD
ncbi:MAG: hypothetical protein LQ350_006678 [Teloschistes chrysophthalmus]|nr:MAG: hypothetical protein LQ350_006678 [Niorma chrysophthalma]